MLLLYKPNLGYATYMLRLITYIFILWASVQAVWAQNCRQHEADLVIENDSILTLGGGTDRYYSSGFEALFKCYTNPDDESSQSNLAFRTLNWFESNSDFIRTSKGFKLGQKIYTSSDLTLSPEEIDTGRDRPYAGWTYASFFYEAETLQDRYLRHEFSFGCVGPCSQAENSQTEWHELFGFVRPEGWDLQIKNQLALQYFLEYKTNRHEIFPFISLHPRYKASLGAVFNDISFGGEFIIGDKSNEQLNKPTYEYKKWDGNYFYITI